MMTDGAQAFLNPLTAVAALDAKNFKMKREETVKNT
jgi:hypothetical protein